MKASFLTNSKTCVNPNYIPPASTFAPEKHEEIYGKNKHMLHVQFYSDKKINGDILWDKIKDALLSYAISADDELLVVNAIVEEE